MYIKPCQIAPQSAADEARQIIRNCVHCGFCNAVCPTHQLLGSELDSPRGRIYLLKSLLEAGGKEPQEFSKIQSVARFHWDRCLNCLACQSACPSSVDYRHLAELSRELTGAGKRWRSCGGIAARIFSAGLCVLFPYPARLGALLRLGGIWRFLLPRRFHFLFPRPGSANPPFVTNETPHCLLFRGCVQSVVTPRTNEAAYAILQKLNQSSAFAPHEGCCGALDYHFGRAEDAKEKARKNIDSWLPYFDAGCKFLLVSASGCGSMLQEYPHLLRDDPKYAALARRLVPHIQEMALYLKSNLSALEHHVKPTRAPVVFQVPCSLQYGQHLPGLIEEILQTLGFNVCSTNQEQSCCGSAGAYALLHPKIATRLRARKLTHLLESGGSIIATANVGCQIHLQLASPVGVCHWLELLAQGLSRDSTPSAMSHQ